MVHKHLLLITTLCAATHLWAQQLPLKFDHIGLEQGLSESIVLAITQDTQGYMWFGTADGLNRFDGYEFKVFKNLGSDSTSLSANYIPTIYVDRNGFLWVGTLGGLDLYDRKHERFIRYAPELRGSEAVKGLGVNAMVQSKDGAFWIGHNGAGLTRMTLDYSSFPPRVKTFHIYQEDRANLRTLLDGNISGIAEDSAGTLWIATWQGGLCRFDPGTETFVRFVHSKERPQSLCMNLLRAVQCDSHGSLWIASEGNGLDRLDIRSLNLQQPEKTRFQHFRKTGREGSISFNTVRALLPQEAGQLWVGTDGGGLNLYNSQTESFVAYAHDKLLPTSIANDRVVSLFEDNTGALWCGTWGSGVSRYSPRKEKFKNSPVLQYVNEHLSSKFLVAIFQDRTGNLWFGTHGAGANRFSPVTKQITYFKHDPNNAKSLSHNVVWSIAEDALGYIWMATDRGLNKLDTATGTFTQFFHNPSDTNSLNSSSVTRVMADDNMNVWVTTGEGLNCVDARSNAVTRISHPADPEQRAAGAIAALAEDQNGIMWVGLGTLLRFDPRQKTFFPANGNTARESVKLISSITVARNGSVWIGTYGYGFHGFNPNDGQLSRFTEADGLPNNVVYGILEDGYDLPAGHAGNLWMSTNKGIARFDPTTKKFTNHDAKDGLQSNEFNRGAYFKARDGMMYFGGINGFNAFHPDSIRGNTHVPNVVLTSFKILDESVRFDSSLSSVRQITLTYKENFFSFEFAALDFTEPSKNQYAYKMEGLETDWVKAGTRRNARYTNVDPGEYVFRIIGSNNDGVWSPEGVSVRVMIAPPFWRTWWFMTAAGFVLASAFGGIVRYTSTRRLKHQVEALERERALQQERERISRDLHDNVGAQLVNIISGLDLVGKYTPPAETRAQRLLKSLQEDARSSILQLRETIWAIKTKAMTLEAFVQQVEAYSRKQLEFHDDVVLHVEAQCGASFELTPIQVLNSFRIIQESLTNCIKHARAKNIWIEVRSAAGGSLRIAVRDDGIGARNGSNDLLSGNGVLNMRRRAEEIGGTFSISSTGMGTTVNLELFVSHGKP